MQPIVDTPTSWRSKPMPSGQARRWPAPIRRRPNIDAALIAERRAAGVYGPRRHRRQRLATAAGIAAGLAVIVFLIV